MLFVCVSMEILAMFEFPSLFYSMAYLYKRRAIYILTIFLLIHVGCIAVACRVPENKPLKIFCLASNKVNLHDITKHSKSKITKYISLRL